MTLEYSEPSCPGLLHMSIYHHPEGPLSEAGRGEDLVVSVAIERGILLLALLDLGECLIVRLAQPLDHGRDSACAVRRLGAQCRAGAVPGGGEVCGPRGA